MEQLNTPANNLGLSWDEKSRQDSGLKGLLPPRTHSLKSEAHRALSQLRGLATGLENKSSRIGMKDCFTILVGQGCVKYSEIFRRPRGMWISIKDAGNVRKILKNWPEPKVKVIVMTDGERILGLGDLGANGMGIPVGKLILYSVCAGINPNQCLPLTLDCGTNNESLRNDPLYIGNKFPRVRGEEYDRFIEEVMFELDREFKSPLIQFEDFANLNSFRLLDQYRNKFCTFNDDIQGTAAAAVTGLLGAAELLKTSLSSHKILFLGAGAAGLGIADLIVKAVKKEGMSDVEAHKRCWFVDSRGLVVKSRWDELRDEKKPYAHDSPQCSSFLESIKVLKPTCIIGVSGQPKTFNREVIEAMGTLNERPIIFALSNPTSKAECSAQQAYEWTNGRAVFASGSPFDPVRLNGKLYTPGQGNNAYIFPGIGLGVVASKTKIVTEEMFLVAAESLAKQVTQEEKDMGCIYPSLERIRDVSFHVAVAVAEEAVKSGLSQVSSTNIQKLVQEEMFDTGALPPAAISASL